MKFLSVGAQLFHADGQTDMTRLLVAYRNFANMLKNESTTSNNSGNWTISKSLTQYLNNIPGKREIKKLQKTAIFPTAHILRKVLM
jgi:hypothetical protein